MTGKWCHAIIHTDALAHNLAVVKQHCPTSAVVAMVKSNAYGHDVAIIAQALQQAGVTRFGVATFDEAVALRDAGITGTILLADTSWVESPKALMDLAITPLISSVHEIQVLQEHVLRTRCTQPYPVHLKVDTGMSRMGVTLYPGKNSVAHALDRIKQTPWVHLQGMCTHFADADECDDSLLRCQIKHFGRALNQTYQTGLAPQVVHIANSAALLRGYHQGRGLLDTLAKQPQWWVRPGGLLYGLNLLAQGAHKQSNASEPGVNLRGVLTWRAPILLRKRIPKGACVGYGSTWRAERDTEIAVLAVGYGDGYNRLLSNRGHVLIGTQRAPIVGRVSMDLTTVDVTDVQCRLGKEACQQGVYAVLLGPQGEKSVDPWELARLCSTIPYEICTSITARVPRIIASSAHNVGGLW